MHPPEIRAILRSPIRSFRSLFVSANTAVFVAAEWLGKSQKDDFGGAPILDPTTHKEAYHLALIKDAENNKLGAGIEISSEKVA